MTADWWSDIHPTLTAMLSHNIPEYLNGGPTIDAIMQGLEIAVLEREKLMRAMGMDPSERCGDVVRVDAERERDERYPPDVIKEILHAMDATEAQVYREETETECTCPRCTGLFTVNVGDSLLYHPPAKGPYSGMFPGPLAAICTAVYYPDNHPSKRLYNVAIFQKSGAPVASPPVQLRLARKSEAALSVQAMAELCPDGLLSYEGIFVADPPESA